MKVSHLLFLSILPVVLAGCGDGNNDYACKMPNGCAPVRMTYNNARQNTSWSGWSVDAPYNAKKQDKKKIVLAPPGSWGYQNQAMVTEHPVYHPATPYMVWLAPYVTKDNHLHSSSLEWFTTPGYWEGPDGIVITPQRRRDAGENSGVTWHPLSTHNIGFKTIGQAVAAQQTSGVLNNIVQPK